MARTLAELLADAGQRHEPGLVSGDVSRPGGVDPLGLRQINFDLMDQVFPGVNNVARHIRPFVVVTWAWRQAAQLAHRDGLASAKTDRLRDFVDRIEVIFVWSQLLPPRNVDLPGRDVLAGIIRDGVYRFGGDDWKRRRSVREYSTALSAPINYGPALKRLGWLVPAIDGSGALQPSAEAIPAIDALEARLAPFLDHPAFASLDFVEVVTADVQRWSGAWAVEDATPAEQMVMRQLLCGEAADRHRRAGVALTVEAALASVEREPDEVRRLMCGPPANFAPSAEAANTALAWRRVQVRQLFRLALEALFAWTIDRLDFVPCPTSAVVEKFLQALEADGAITLGEWIAQGAAEGGPVERIKDLEAALQTEGRSETPEAFHRALSFCLSEAPPQKEEFEPEDRLPLVLAAEQAKAWRDQPLRAGLARMLEVWLFGQHTYWAVGRGLADARSDGNHLLRLRVVMEEGGWCLTRSGAVPTPLPTADRLATILSLAAEAGLLLS